jgi:PhnB protein
VTAYICVKDSAKAIEFYKKAFGATENYRLKEPSGRIGHAEIAIGGSTMMLSDEYPDYGALSPPSLGGSPVTFHLRVADADAAVKRAVDAGGTLLRPVENQFYGERTGMVTDPFGYRWFLAAHVEDVSPDDMQKRWNKAFES